jgi:hypothetical protein
LAEALSEPIGYELPGLVKLVGLEFLVEIFPKIRSSFRNWKD